MTKRFQQLISCLLALGLVLAGWVAFSPALHVLIEHGGHGPAHVHFHGSALSRLHQADETRNLPDPDISVSGPVFRSTHRPFALPNFSVRAAWDALARLTAADAVGGPGETSPDPVAPAPSHDHHSLAQTLADGCLESSFHPVFQKLGFDRLELTLPTWHGAMLERFFDAQAAGRAPPFIRS
ncbi:MAG: hypothetical protein JNN07_00025 [Verrucomicrobiales bacterium]|nr:hypothetical protein [Verrucomicrobiales bacterium]